MSEKQPNIVRLLLGQLRLGRAGLLRRRDPSRRTDAAHRRPRRRGPEAPQHERRGAVHAEPLGGADRAPPDPLGHADRADHRRPRRPDPLGGHHRPGAFRCRLRHRHVGQVAPRQRSEPAQPRRLRVRRGGLEPAHRGRGLLDDAVLLPGRAGRRGSLRGQGADPAGVPDRSTRARRARRPRPSVPTTPSSGRASTARSPTGRSTS